MTHYIDPYITHIYIYIYIYGLKIEHSVLTCGGPDRPMVPPLFEAADVVLVGGGGGPGGRLGGGGGPEEGGGRLGGGGGVRAGPADGGPEGGVGGSGLPTMLPGRPEDLSLEADTGLDCGEGGGWERGGCCWCWLWCDIAAARAATLGLTESPSLLPPLLAGAEGGKRGLLALEGGGGGRPGLLARLDGLFAAEGGGGGPGLFALDGGGGGPPGLAVLGGGGGGPPAPFISRFELRLFILLGSDGPFDIPGGRIATIGPWPKIHQLMSHISFGWKKKPNPPLMIYL